MDLLLHVGQLDVVQYGYQSKAAMQAAGEGTIGANQETDSHPGITNITPMQVDDSAIE